jgi:hypothetical protein
VDVLGTPAVAARVTQSFGTKHYSADLELAAPLHFNGDSPAVSLSSLGSGSPSTRVPNVSAWSLADVRSDAKRIDSVTSAVASATVTTSTAGSFNTSMIGKKAVCFSESAKGSLRTVASVTDSQTLVLDGDSGITLPVGGFGFVIVGTDDTRALQAAIDAAAASYRISTYAHAGVNVQRGAAGPVVLLPSGVDGNYTLITSGITIPAGVVFDGEGTIFASLTDLYAPAITVAPYGGIRRLLMDCNDGSGIEVGTIGETAHCFLETVRLWRVGTSYDAAAQFGIRLHGWDHGLGQVWIKGGNKAVDIVQASDVHCDHLFSIGAAVGIAIAGGEQIRFDSVLWDTANYVPLMIDTSNNVFVKGRAFINNDGSPGTVNAYGALIGEYTSSPRNRGIEVDLALQNTGGHGVKISNTEDCKITLTCSDAALFTGGTTPLDTAVEYGSNNAGFLDITLIKSAAITASTGTPYGTLRT